MIDYNRRAEIASIYSPGYLRQLRREGEAMTCTRCNCPTCTHDRETLRLFCQRVTTIDTNAPTTERERDALKEHIGAASAAVPDPPRLCKPQGIKWGWQAVEARDCLWRSHLAAYAADVEAAYAAAYTAERKRIAEWLRALPLGSGYTASLYRDQVRAFVNQLDPPGDAP